MEKVKREIEGRMRKYMHNKSNPGILIEKGVEALAREELSMFALEYYFERYPHVQQKLEEMVMKIAEKCGMFPEYDAERCCREEIMRLREEIRRII